MHEIKVLIVDCDSKENIGDTLEAILLSSRSKANIRRSVIAEGQGASLDKEWFQNYSDFEPAVVFLALPRPSFQHSCTLIQSISAYWCNAPLIVVLAECNPAETLELLRKGASDFITLPLRAADTLARVWRLLEQRQSPQNVVHALKEKVGLRLLIGKAPVFSAEVKKIPLIAQSDSRVLITGETGTGKEMCARAIHYLSPRAGNPFVPVNCGAIPVELVENELFGHDAGAFTGANTAKAGLIEEAESGTLFLDEIDCLPPAAQVKLLRFLQEKEYRRLGSSKVRRADVRVITASNSTLDEALQKGQIRQDLYYRLNVISLALPPLRERREDIPVLAQHFLEKYSNEFRRETNTISPEATLRLISYDWPGNVRELEHTIERAVMFSESRLITEDDIVLPVAGHRSEDSFREAKAKVVEQFERAYIQRLLASNDGNISKAAQSARKNRRAFWELMRKHGISAARD